MIVFGLKRGIAGEGCLISFRPVADYYDAMKASEDLLRSRKAKKGNRMQRSFYYDIESTLYSSSQNFADRISAGRAELRLSDEIVERYLEINAAYRAAYMKTAMADTKSKSDVSRKNSVKKELRQVAAGIAKLVDGNPDVSDAQRILLGLVIRTKGSRIGPPDARPAVLITSVMAWTVKIRIYDPLIKRRGKPPGIAWASVLTHVGRQFPADIKEWKTAGHTTRNTMDIHFPPSIGNGAQVWICARWMNRKTEAGPTSNPIATHVQGGLSMAG